MVALSAMRASNARIASELPAGLVAVFAGSTNGIGETAMRQFARLASRPRIYFVGRSQEAGDRLTAELQALNPSGRYEFVQADLSQLKVVDRVCRQIKEKEEAINLVVISIGSMVMDQYTPEGLNFTASLIHYARYRMIQNLLPQLQRATSLRRVVSIFAGTKEGPINTSDWALSSARNPMKARGHAASLVTLGLSDLAAQAPSVSFIHSFPGPVRSGILRGTSAWIRITMGGLSALLGRFFYIDTDESGEFHAFLATSGMYAAKARAGGEEGQQGVDGVAIKAEDAAKETDRVRLAKGVDGQAGSGVYAVDQFGESQDEKQDEVLRQLRSKEVGKGLMEHTRAEYVRILGSAEPLA